MNWLDIVLLLVVVASTVAGLARGLTRMVIGLVTTVAAIFLSFSFYQKVAIFFLQWEVNPRYAQIAAFVSIFVGVLILGGVLSVVIGKALRAVGLKFADRLAGTALGFVRGVLICIVIVMAIMAGTKGLPESVRGSRLAPHILRASNLLVSLAPAEMRDAYDISKDKLLKTWKEIKGEAKRLPEDKL